MRYQEKLAAAPLTPYNRGYLDGAEWAEAKAEGEIARLRASQTEERLALSARLAVLFQSKEWKMVARHSPLCNPEIEQLRKSIVAVVEGVPR